MSTDDGQAQHYRLWRCRGAHCRQKPSDKNEQITDSLLHVPHWKDGHLLVWNGEDGQQDSQGISRDSPRCIDKGGTVVLKLARFA